MAEPAPYPKTVAEARERFGDLNPRWLACGVAHGREFKPWEFMIWIGHRWEDYRAECGVARRWNSGDRTSLIFAGHSQVDVEFDAWVGIYAEGVQGTAPDPLAFGPDRAPDLAPVAKVDSPIVAFQAVAATHSALTACVNCGSVVHGMTHPEEAEIEDDECGVEREVCPCGESLVLIDAQTANLVVLVHARLNERNRARYEKQDLATVVAIAHRIWSQQ